MLKSFSKGLSAAALATIFTASAAQADNHTVLIMDGGFFPAVTYTKPGDNVIFTNNSASALKLAGADSSWVSESISVDSTYTLNVTGSTSLDFVALDNDAAVTGDEGESDAEYINLDDVIMEGALSFNDAPLEGYDNYEFEEDSEEG